MGVVVAGAERPAGERDRDQRDGGEQDSDGSHGDCLLLVAGVAAMLRRVVAAGSAAPHSPGVPSVTRADAEVRRPRADCGLDHAEELDLGPRRLVSAGHPAQGAGLASGEPVERGGGGVVGGE
jgi:hypothetical protein